jgi:cation transport protein ChaC
MVALPAAEPASDPKSELPRGWPGRGQPWVFGYGSLMWDPGFDHGARVPAAVFGYHRRFCVYSHRYRGTPDRPGLVLGLDHGGCCHGLAFRIESRHLDAVLAYLWRRELLTRVYRPRILAARLAGGRRIRALAFVVDRRHGQYAAGLSPLQTAALVLQGHGGRGPCRDYLANTLRHLAELGLADRGLGQLETLVDRLCAGTLAMPRLPPAPPPDPAVLALASLDWSKQRYPDSP